MKRLLLLVVLAIALQSCTSGAHDYDIRAKNLSNGAITAYQVHCSTAHIYKIGDTITTGYKRSGELGNLEPVKLVLEGDAREWLTKHRIDYNH